MDAIKLIFAKKPRKGESCFIKVAGDKLELLDSSDDLVASIDCAEALMRIQLPSFWTSRYIVIEDDEETFCFEPKPKAVERVRSLIKRLKSEGHTSGMAEATHRTGMWNLLLGAGLMVFGIILSVISYTLAAPGGTYLVMTGLITGGIILVVKGINYLSTADNLRRKMEKRDSLQSIACTTCRAPMRVQSQHAGKMVVCPSCQSSVRVPAFNTDDEDRFSEKRKPQNIPIGAIAIGGAVILIILIGLAWYLSGDNNPNVVLPAKPFQLPPHMQANNKAGNASQPANSPESGIHTEHEMEDPQLGAQRPFAVDPGLLRKSGSVYLGDLTEFAFKKGADDWTFSKHGKLHKPFGKADILVNGKPVKEGLSMHPPHSGYTRVAYVIGRSAQKLIGSVGMSEDEPHFKPQPTRFVIMGDGKLLWRSKSIAGFGMQDAFNLKISNVDLLELRIYSETFNITGSHAVWIDPQVDLPKIQ